MWTNVKVQNYQSLKGIDLDLGLFTVILGQSSSGKSALIRALRALVSNARGSSFITRGEKDTTVTVVTDSFTACLMRSGSAGIYTISGGSGEAVFTKLGGTVPPLVSECLRVPPVDSAGSLHFAEQFDRPYLLNESGATVARVLGELTNVNIIFEAAREANRRRLNTTRDLTIRKSDLQNLVEKANSFRNLPKQLAACEVAEKTLDEIKQITDKVRVLKSTVSDVEITTRELTRVSIPEVPNIDEVLSEYNKLIDFKSLVRDWAVTQRELTAAEKTFIACKDRVIDLTNQLSETLVKAGECPLCHQQIVDQHSAMV